MDLVMKEITSPRWFFWFIVTIGMEILVLETIDNICLEQSLQSNQEQSFTETSPSNNTWAYTNHGFLLFVSIYVTLYINK